MKKEHRTIITSGTFTGEGLTEPYQYICPAGFCEAPTFLGLIWEVLKHRAWHLKRGDGWTD
jgi:hypothetical protein